MIARDEEINIARALNSVKGAVDEIIVVDTGSSDRTSQIAGDLGAKVYHHPWQDSFSEARNHSLAYATGDWIFYIDADEELHPEDGQKLRDLVEKAGPDTMGFNVLLYQLYDNNLSVADQFFAIRVFRRHPKIRFWGRVHNQLNINQARTKPSDIRVRHYGWIKDYSRKKAKTERTRKLLEKQLAETPDIHFLRYHLGGIYCDEGNLEKGIPLLKEAVELLDEPRHKAKACYVLGVNLKVQGNVEESEKYLLKSLEIIPWFLMARYTLADLYATGLSRLDKAIEEMERIVHRTMDIPPEFLDIGHHPHIESVSAPWNLAIYYQAVGKLEEAANLLSKVALQKGEQELEVRSDLANLLLRMGRPDQAARELFLVRKIDPNLKNIALRLENALERAGSLEEALKVLEEEMEANPENQGYLTAKGRLLMKSGDLLKAETALKEAVGKSAPEYEPSRLLLAETIRRLSELERNPARMKEAVTLVQNVLARNPQSAAARNVLAGIQQTLAALST